jgi:hypothetical protein
MIDYYETKSQPITRMMVWHIHNVSVTLVIYKQEEPYEGRLSRTVVCPGKVDVSSGCKFHQSKSQSSVAR